MPNPAVSVIMRTKDRPLLLHRGIQSVLRQSFKDWELIVVNDGGATEPVDELLAELSNDNINIRICHRTNSGGMESASNFGIAQSRGKYLIIHDDDDSWEPDFLAETMLYLEQADNPDGDAGVSGERTHSR